MQLPVMLDFLMESIPQPDEVEIEDMVWNEDLEAYTYQCPCGDLFQITLVSLPYLAGQYFTRRLGRVAYGRGNSSLSKLFACYKSSL